MVTSLGECLQCLALLTRPDKRFLSSETICSGIRNYYLRFRHGHSTEFSPGNWPAGIGQKEQQVFAFAVLPRHGGMTTAQLWSAVCKT